MSEQADSLRARFEAMDDAALKAEADARNIHGRHLIKKRETFVDKLVAHEAQMAAIDPGAVEAGATPDRTVGGMDGQRQLPSAAEKALEDTEARRSVPALKLPPQKAPPPPSPSRPAPPPSMQIVAGQEYVVRKDFPLNISGLMTTIAKGSIVSRRTHSKLQMLVSRGLKLRRIDGAKHGMDRLGVQQTTTVYGGDDDDDLDDDDVSDNGVDMRAFLQMTNDLSRAHTRIAVLEGELETARGEAAAAKALLDEAS